MMVVEVYDLDEGSLPSVVLAAMASRVPAITTNKASIVRALQTFGQAAEIPTRLQPAFRVESFEEAVDKLLAMDVRGVVRTITDKGNLLFRLSGPCSQSLLCRYNTIGEFRFLYCLRLAIQVEEG